VEEVSEEEIARVKALSGEQIAELLGIDAKWFNIDRLEELEDLVGHGIDAEVESKNFTWRFKRALTLMLKRREPGNEKLQMSDIQMEDIEEFFVSKLLAKPPLAPKPRPKSGMRLERTGKHREGSQS
jgi:hypothetical protein